MIGKKVMEVLRRHIGKKVTVEYVWYGQIKVKKGVLKKVTDFVNIETEGIGIPFIGYNCAIRRIIGESGETLYENPLIFSNYNLQEEEEIEGMIAATFGLDVALEFRRRRKKT